MFCKNCGNEVEKDAFCSICGAPLRDDPAAPTTPALSDRTLNISTLVMGIASIAGALGVPVALPAIFNLACGILSILLGNRMKKRPSETSSLAGIGAMLGWCGVIVSAANAILSALAVVAFVIFYFGFIFFMVNMGM